MERLRYPYGEARDAPARQRGWNGGRILVVEDNFLFAELVCDFLRECKLVPVGPAFDVDKALPMAREADLDGAVLDLNLRSGLSLPVCCALSARSIPFLFLTGMNELSVIPVEYRGAPMISKPFDTGELTAALAGIMPVWTPPDPACPTLPAAWSH